MADRVQMTLQSQLIEGTSTVAATITSTVDDAAITEKGADTYTVAANATDFELAVPTGDAKYLHFEGNAACSVKLYGTGSTAIVLNPNAGSPAVLIVAGADIETIHVTNPLGTPLRVRLLVAQ